MVGSLTEITGQQPQFMSRKGLHTSTNRVSRKKFIPYAPMYMVFFKKKDTVKLTYLESTLYNAIHRCYSIQFWEKKNTE